MRISKHQLCLLIIIILAFVLRIIAAHHIHVSTDEMIYSIIPLNIISAGRLGTVEQSPLSFYLADIGYQLFGGISAITVRLPAIIFGTLTTVVIYLICQYLWDNKTGLISSFLFAISGYALSYNYETDMVSFFFAALSLYFFVRYIKEKKRTFIYLTAVSFGLGILAKTPVILFIPAFTFIYLYDLIKTKSYLDLKVIATAILSVFLVVLVLMPIISYNYLIYQENGITDAYTSLFLGIGKTVHTGLESEPWSSKKLWIVTTQSLKENFVKNDFILFLFGLIGMIYGFKSQRLATILIILTALLFHIRVAGQTGSSSHYLWYPIVFGIFSGIGITHWSNSLKNKFKIKYFSLIMIVVALISAFFVIGEVIKQREASITLSLRDYVREEISEEAVVIIDPRIYRGIHAWVFNDKHYLDGTNFGLLTDQIQKSSERKFEVDLFYVECGEGTNCGWKPEDFARIFETGKSISVYFQENTNKVKEIRAGHNFNIYKGSMRITPRTYETVDRTHLFWFYPVGWKYTDNVIDNYTARGWGVFLNFIGFATLWINVILAIFTIPAIIYLGFKKHNHTF